MTTTIRSSALSSIPGNMCSYCVGAVLVCAQVCLCLSKEEVGNRDEE